MLVRVSQRKIITRRIAVDGCGAAGNRQSPDTGRVEVGQRPPPGREPTRSRQQTGRRCAEGTHGSRATRKGTQDAAQPIFRSGEAGDVAQLEPLCWVGPSSRRRAAAAPLRVSSAFPQTQAAPDLSPPPHSSRRYLGFPGCSLRLSRVDRTHDSRHSFDDCSASAAGRLGWSPAWIDLGTCPTSWPTSPFGLTCVWRLTVTHLPTRVRRQTQSDSDGPTQRCTRRRPVCGG